MVVLDTITDSAIVHRIELDSCATQLLSAQASGMAGTLGLMKANFNNAIDITGLHYFLHRH